MRKMTVRYAANNSAMIKDIQIPLIPQKMGKINTAAIWNTIVRKKDNRAEIQPLFSAVKNAEP